MTSVKTLYPNNTNVKFQHKDERPNITTGDRFNTDVMIISIKLNGRIIKNFVKTSNINCLTYLIAADVLSMIVSIKENTRDYDAGNLFSIILHDNASKTDTTYAFDKIEYEYMLQTATADSDETIEHPTFKLVAYRPARVTKLVYVDQSDENSFNLALNPKRNPAGAGEVIVFNPEEGFDIDTAIDLGYGEKKYRACTLFVNMRLADVPKNNDINRFGTYAENITKLKAKFRIVNVLLSDGRILKL